MLVGHGFSFLLQAAYFVLLARLLGVKEYGVFAGAFALVGIVAPYSTLGSGILFMRYVGSGQGEAHAHWANVLVSTLTVGSGLTLVLYLLAPHLINEASASIVLVVAIGNCVFSQLLPSIGQMFQTLELMRISAILNLLTNFLRLFAVSIMTFVLHHATARIWAIASLLVSMLAAIAGVLFVTFYFGKPRYTPGLFRSNAAEGLGFSIGGSAQSIYNDIDKTLLSHYGMNLQNGIYTMAYRIVDIATIPIMALDSAALPRYFRQSREGYASVTSLAIRLAKRAGLLGVALSVCLFLSAPLIPRVVGKGFADSVLALRWLCLLPVFRGVHQLMGSAIAGIGFQRYRTMAQFSAAAINFALNLWLMPGHGWLGAAWASLVTDGLLAVTNWLILRNLIA